MKIVDTDELSKTLKVCRATTLGLAKRGIIPSLRVGHGLRFDLSEVIEAQRRAQTQTSMSEGPGGGLKELPQNLIAGGK
jgi:hypothetical protein